jgi:diguanylate cyclase (GGDEF)-like protein
MKQAHTKQTSANRRWPAIHGQNTYSFVPAPPELSVLRTHISTLEERIERQAALIESLAEKANHDSLTGLLNRRGMENALGKAIENFTRYGHQGALMMFDLNGFKQVNDVYGHAAGDALLRRVADVLRDNTRGTDNLCRLGGDEFMVFLVGAGLSQALIMARRLRTALEQTPVNYDGNILTANISVGIATLEEAPSLPELIELADSRMYRLKQALKSIRA